MAFVVVTVRRRCLCKGVVVEPCVHLVVEMEVRPPNNMRKEREIHEISTNMNSKNLFDGGREIASCFDERRMYVPPW